MGVDQWTAIGGLAVAVFGGIVSGLVYAMRKAYTDGQKDQIMDQLRSEFDGMKVRLDEHAQKHANHENWQAVISATFESLKGLVSEVRDDVKAIRRGPDSIRSPRD